MLYIKNIKSKNVKIRPLVSNYNIIVINISSINIKNIKSKNVKIRPLVSNCI